MEYYFLLEKQGIYLGNEIDIWGTGEEERTEYKWVKVKVLVVQLCPTLCDPMDWDLPGSSVHGFSRQEC